MLTLKELIVVLAISALVFWLAKPMALLWSEERDFARRRNLWLGLTAVEFLSPNIWIFILCAAPLLFWAGRKDRSPAALYLLMLHLAPPVEIDIPFPGINSLFAIDNYRLLSLCVLIPAALRLRKSQDPARIRGVTSVDLLILFYGILQVILFVPPNVPGRALVHDSLTNELRNAFTYTLDYILPYYVISRSSSTRAAISECLAGLVLSCAIMAAIALFEAARHWPQYSDIAFRWTGDAFQSFARYRGGALRAQASSGSPLALSYMLAIACGIWSYLGSYAKTKTMRYGVMFLLWLGLVCTWSRGPWVGTMVIYFVIMALGRRAVPKMIKGSLTAALTLLVAMQFPVGDRILRLLPFMKNSGDEETNFSITYRQRLATRSWDLIQGHPFFGDQMALQKLEDLRQGEGIIDTVNTYAEVTMFYGFIGITAFILAIIIPLFGAFRTVRNSRATDPDLAALGTALVASIVGTMMMLITCSFIMGYTRYFYALAALAAAYTHLGRSAKSRREDLRAPVGAAEPQQ